MSHIREYKRLRKADRPAQEAWRSAKVRERFEQLEEAGLVRIRVEPDLDGYNVDHVDTWGLRPSEAEREKRSLLERAERDGCWGIIAEVLCPCCGHWTIVDSCWGFLGNDWADSGYDTDLMSAAVEHVSSPGYLASQHKVAS